VGGKKNSDKMKLYKSKIRGGAGGGAEYKVSNPCWLGGGGGRGSEGRLSIKLRGCTKCVNGGGGGKGTTAQKIKKSKRTPPPNHPHNKKNTPPPQKKTTVAQGNTLATKQLDLGYVRLGGAHPNVAGGTNYRTFGVSDLLKKTYGRGTKPHPPPQ